MRRKTTEEFKQDLFNLVGDEYSLIGEYVNIKTKVTLRHNKCGYEYEVHPNNFLLKNRRCPKCNNTIKVIKTTEIFKQEVFDLVGKKYTVLGEYVNNRTKILMRHNKCGYEYEVRPDNFLNSHRRCPKCAIKKVSKSNRKTLEEFKQKVYDLVGNEYIVLGEYINSDTKILMRHNKCGYEYEVLPYNFTASCRARRCPKCKESKAERKISNYLIEHNIKFEKEKRFKDCKDKRQLPFDFYLEDYNLLIEFDGIQHYQEANFGWGAMPLSKYQYHDEIKTKYCEDNNYNLLRISYKQFDTIEKVLNKYFKTHKPIKN